ncbi:MAG: response regulator transcription factor [Syntrophomonadaceae bacterium]|nr:response regulator transcription factor [Syntrophomonadaceae bacterium]
MSIHVIITQAMAQAVAKTLQARGLGDAPMRIVAQSQGPGALEEAGRVPASVLILDVGTGPGLGAAVLRYRLARPQARIILLATGRQPGDPEVAQIVQAGVYDIVTDPESLAAAMDRQPAGLESAALWLDPSLAPGGNGGKTVVERVVERKVPMTQRPTLIAAAGMAPGVGTTTMAQVITHYLAWRGHTTTLVDMSAPWPAEQYTLPWRPPEIPEEPTREVANLWVCRQSDPMAVVRRRQTAYVVADAGHVSAEVAAGLGADLLIIVLPNSPSRVSRLFEYAYCRDRHHIILPDAARYAILGTGESAQTMADAWQEWVDYISRPRPGYLTPAILVPMPDTMPPRFGGKKDHLAPVIATLIQGVLPEPERRRGWFFRR